MTNLTVQIPDPNGQNEEYAIMDAVYRRDGKEKNTRTTLAFKDYCGCYTFEVTFKDDSDTCHAFFDVEELTVTFKGGYEADDLIKLFRKIVEHHDMQQLILQGKPQKEDA